MNRLKTPNSKFTGSKINVGVYDEKSYTPTFFFYNKEKPPSASLPNSSLGGASNA